MKGSQFSHTDLKNIPSEMSADDIWGVWIREEVEGKNEIAKRKLS